MKRVIDCFWDYSEKIKFSYNGELHMKMKNLLSIISMILTLAMSLALCVPAFAAENGIPTDSMEDAETMYNAEEVGMTERGITRDARPPREFYDLSKGSYSVDGTFEVSIYSARYFKPNEDGELRYSVVLTWENEFDVYPDLPDLTVECWDKTTGKQATTTTFESETDHWPFLPVIPTGNRLISGLNTDHEYYFIFRKNIPGALATVTGTISH